MSKLKAQPRGRAVKFVATRNSRAELSWWSNRLLHIVPRPMSALAAELLPITDAIVAYTDASGLGLGVYVPGPGLWTFMHVPERFAVNPAAHTDSVISVGSTLIEVAAVVTWIPGLSNVVADPISRGNFAAFRAIVPSAATLPFPCPGSPFDAIP